MKKKLIAAIFMAMFVVSSSLFALIDFSPTGWTSSNGKNTADGQAVGTRPIPGGWSFRCVGGGVCYTINGGWLEINQWSAGPPPDPEGPSIDITETPE